MLARETQQAQAQGVGLFALLRELERNSMDRPRIGRNTRLRDAVVRLGQDPFLAFPDTDLARVDRARRAPMVRAQFLGFFGAFGALPLSWTEEVKRWFDAGDASFVAFTDIFAARFQEFFFRAWSDARPITQFDHADDQFQTWLLSLLGSGTNAFRNRGSVVDTVRLRLAPLAMGRVKSPVRLRQMLQLHFNGAAQVTIEEMVPSWLSFEPDAHAKLGIQNASLGRDCHLGQKLRAVGQKIRIHLCVDTYDAYQRFLPGGQDFIELQDITYWYIGQMFEIDVLLWLPQPQVKPAILGQCGTLGWMACLAPNSDTHNKITQATRFALIAPSDPLNTTVIAAA
ncbi:type VI secretion protein [Thioclava sp. SK-1]|nr:type VI secretion protein [Thioclava sp. SK-1]